MRRRKWFVILGMLLILSTALSADQYWIKAGATGDGRSKTSPSGKLHDLLAAALRGDVFHIAEGEYYGRNNTGEFAVNVPDLTLAGGYSSDFSVRNPFRYLTILMRKPGVTTDYTRTLGGIIGMNPDAHAEGQIASSTGLILDGLIFDGSTRNVYSPNDRRLAPAGSWKEAIIKLVASDNFTSGNIRIRNCVVINGYYQGIYVKWMGADNEVTNSLIVNNMINGIDASGAQGTKNLAEGSMDGASILIRNNTIGYNWDHDKAQAGRGIKTVSGGTITNNIIVCLQGGSREAVQFAPGTVEIKDNVFWMTAETDADQIPDGNTAQNPGLSPDKIWFESFSGFAAKFGKIRLDVINAERTAQGLAAFEKLGGAAAPENVAFGKPYPFSADIFRAFTSKIPGMGFSTEVVFESYSERNDNLPGFTAGSKEGYREISWDQLKGKTNAGSLDGVRVKIQAGLNPRKATPWLSKYGIDAVNYVAFELRKPGTTRENLSERIMAYALIGSGAGNRFNAIGHKGVRKDTWSSGVTVYGTLYAEGTGSYPYSLLVEAID